MKGKVIRAVLCLLACLIFPACIKEKDKEEMETAEKIEVEQTEAFIFAEVETAAESEEPEIQVISEEPETEQVVEEILAAMTLEEKIGQLLYVDLDALNEGGTALEMNGLIEENLETLGVGGVILFSQNIRDTEQVKTLLADLQEAGRYPMFLGVDEEGGMVQRIGGKEQMGAESIPDMQSIGNTGDSAQAYEVGEKLGVLLKELGFNMDFAPVADVITNAENTEIGSRSFGTDPQMAADMVGQAVKGIQDQGISAAIKHFPGHGGSSVNSHYGYSETLQTLEGLWECEFLPFRAGIEAGTDFVLISHLAVPEVTGDRTPASLSNIIVTDLLREELGYDGIVITDGLNMGAVSNYYTSAEAAVKAVEAGVDMLLMPASPQGAWNGLLEAVNSGVITEERIDESVRRILLVKNR